MISRLFQLLVFLCMYGSAFAQSQSFYIKAKNDEDVSKITQSLKETFSDADVYSPFSRNRFENLHRIVRIDVNASESEVKMTIDFPIEYMEAVPIGKIAYTPDDLKPEFGTPNQWYLHKIGAQGAWDYSKGNSDVSVAIVDNGFLASHPELEGKIAINENEIPFDGIDNDNNGFIDDRFGWNARLNNGDVYNSGANTAHGTHVAGIAAASTDNSVGGSSLSFLTKWLPVKVADDNDNVTHGYEGISFAAERGAKVINCSWGSFDSSATAKSVINFALSKNCFLVASAGNFSSEMPSFPATYQGVISVASTTQTDAKLNTSSFGRRVNISAPGSGIWSTIFNASQAADYGFMSGTSMASPVVSALLSLMSGYAPANQDSVILNCMYSTAVDIYDLPANSAYDSLLGSGRIDAEAAMRCLQQAFQLSITENSYAADLLNIYPNPSENVFHIFSIDDIKTWQLHDLTGKIILTGFGQKGDVSTIPSGVYFLTIEFNSYPQQKTIKLIKK